MKDRPLNRFGATVTFGHKLFNPGPPHADQGKFCRYKKTVKGHQHQDQAFAQGQQIASPVPLLGRARRMLRPLAHRLNSHLRK